MMALLVLVILAVVACSIAPAASRCTGELFGSITGLLRKILRGGGGGGELAKLLEMFYPQIYQAMS